MKQLVYLKGCSAKHGNSSETNQCPSNSSNPTQFLVSKIYSIPELISDANRTDDFNEHLVSFSIYQSRSQNGEFVIWNLNDTVTVGGSGKTIPRRKLSQRNKLQLNAIYNPAFGTICVHGRLKQKSWKIMNRPCFHISMQNAGSLYNAVLLNISWNLQRKLEVNNTQKRKFIALDGCHSIHRWILRKLRIDGEDPAAIYDKKVWHASREQHRYLVHPKQTFENVEELHLQISPWLEGNYTCGQNLTQQHRPSRNVSINVRWV